MITLFVEAQWVCVDQDLAAGITLPDFYFDIVEYFVGSQQRNVRLQFEVKLDDVVIAAETGFHIVKTPDVRMREGHRFDSLSILERNFVVEQDLE
jgi:hypothetical protein